MIKRDTVVLVVAVVCGLLAFVMVMNLTKKSGHFAGVPTALKSGGPASLPIPAGMSALTLSDKNVENFPDLLEVGGFVDILGTVPDYQGKMELQAIIRSAQVITLDRTKEDQLIRSINVALTPAGAEVVSKAMANGKIRLILRPEQAEKSVVSLGAGVTEVIRGVEKDKNARV